MLRKLLLLVLVLGSAATAGASAQPTAPEKKVIAYAQLKQETNVFSPVKTTLRDFEAVGLYYGQDIPSKANEGEIAGFLKAVKKMDRGDLEIVPVLRAAAMSGGPIEAGVYQRFKGELLKGLEAIPGLDGIYLSMHGSMGVEGIWDPEGDLLSAIREKLGSEIPIGISFDLHANITKAKATKATFIVGYKTNPHRDQAAAGYSCGEILIRTVRGEIKPVMVYQKMKLLKGGGMNIDLLKPMNKIFRAMKRMERDKEVLSVSNFMVHVWLDEPELGWSTVAITDNNPKLAEKLSLDLAEKNWAVRTIQPPAQASASEAVKRAARSWFARKFGTVTFCDVSDAVGAGAPGENTWILKALLDEGSNLVSYVPLRDAEAAKAAFAAPLNEEITLTVGGRLETVHNKPVTITGKVIRKLEGRYGKTVILKSNGVHLILSELPAAVTHPKFFKELGLSVWKADIVVVKNLFPFRIWFALYNRKTINVNTPGTTNVDVFELGYKQINRPIYPFDDIQDWR